jgi:hypothetical protein
LEKITSSFIANLSLVRLLALLKIRRAQRAEITGTRACNNDISIKRTHTAHTTIECFLPFMAALSFLCSTELPSAAVSFLELPEKTPERAAKRLRFKPAYTIAISNQNSATFDGNRKWKTYASTSFSGLLATIDHARACGRSILARFLRDGGG